jgi:hypothetical protein
LSLHTVVSIDGSPYQLWQAELLEWTHGRVGQPGPLTWLVAADEAPAGARLARTYATGAMSPHPRTGDDYAPYNKPYSLLAWLADAPPEEEHLLVLDPDCVFLAPLEVLAEPGRPVAQPIWYMNPERYRGALARHCARPDALEPVGIPTAIRRDDLARLTPLWLAKTEEIREDARSAHALGWVAEMWAYAIAAHETGLRHVLRPMAWFNTDDRADLPIVHYCYPYEAPGARWEWGKRTYRPWTRVAEPPAGTPAGEVAVVRLVNEFAEERATAWG